MNETTMLLQENMELYAENQRLWLQVQKLEKKGKHKNKRVSPTAERNEKLKHLRWGKDWTLQEIADEYGLTRERVRQIVGNSGYRNAKTKRNKESSLMNPGLTNKELSDILDVSVGAVSNYRSGTRYAIEGTGVHGVGAAAEDKYADILKGWGFDVELMPRKHEYDALVNGWRVDFKFCKTTKTSPSLKNVNPAWRFNVKRGKKYRSRCDIFFCITENDDVFVIPSANIPESMEHLVFCYPVSHNSKGKWQSYKDRYDLLETRKQEQNA